MSEDPATTSAAAPVADPMPRFVLLAKDEFAAQTVRYYQGLCGAAGLEEQVRQVGLALAEMAAWQRRNPGRMKLPDHAHVPVRAAGPVVDSPVFGDPVGLGQACYEAYTAAVGGRSVHGEVLPSFRGLGQAAVDGWVIAAHAVAARVQGRDHTGGVAGAGG